MLTVTETSEEDTKNLNGAVLQASATVSVAKTEVDCTVQTVCVLQLHSTGITTYFNRHFIMSQHSYIYTEINGPITNAYLYNRNHLKWRGTLLSQNVFCSRRLNCSRQKRPRVIFFFNIKRGILFRNTLLIFFSSESSLYQ